MGGDRDGNPFVTHSVTREVLLLSRWKAADLYLQDINELISELSMTKCNDTVRQLAGEEEHEPYRAVLKQLRTLLSETKEILDAKINGQNWRSKPRCNTSTNFGSPCWPVTSHYASAA